MVVVQYSFYISLEQVYQEMICRNVRTDILLLQADPRNFAFAEELRTIDRNCLILYPARSQELVLQAFASMPMAYIPPRGQGGHSLEQAVLQAVNYLKRIKSEITFETKSNILHYALHEIDYFESQYRLVHIVKRDGKAETITARLDQVQTQLPGSFYRCHQSFLVNMDHIACIDKSNKEVHFQSGQIVPSSKKLFSDFLDAYREFKNGGGADA